MLISCEMPLSILPTLNHETDYDFIIASYCLKNDEYKNFYKNLKDNSPQRVSILDNGAFEEGTSIPSDKYFNLIEEMRPSVVVLPDTVNDKENTLKSSEYFYTRVKEKFGEFFPFELMGVLQGSSINDYLECLHFYASCEDVSFIGVPYHLFYRPLLFEKSDIIKICKKEGLLIHILGLPNPFEVYELMKWKDIIISVDSSLPISSGFHLRHFREGEWKRDRRSLDEKFTASQKIVALDNIRYLKVLMAKGGKLDG